MNTITFGSFDILEKPFTFSVLKEFIKICPDYEKMSTYDLIVKFKLVKYLHNEDGPAIIDNNTGNLYYFLNGKEVDKL